MRKFLLYALAALITLTPLTTEALDNGPKQDKAKAERAAYWKNKRINKKRKKGTLLICTGRRPRNWNNLFKMTFLRDNNGEKRDRSAKRNRR